MALRLWTPPENRMDVFSGPRTPMVSIPDVGNNWVNLGHATQHAGPLTVMDHGVLTARWPFTIVPGALVVASTGAGKTNLVRWMASDLLYEANRVLYLADGGGSDEFNAYKLHSRCAGVADGPEETAEMVCAVFDELERRMTNRAKARQQLWPDQLDLDHAPIEPDPWLFFAIDEYLDFVMALDPKDKSDLGRTSLLKKLTRIIQKGRKVRIRPMLITQRPDAKAIDVGLPSLIKALLKLRIAVPGAVGMDSVESGMIFDNRKLAGAIPTELGWGMVCIGELHVVFKVPDMPDPSDPDRKLTPEQRREAWKVTLDTR